MPLGNPLLYSQAMLANTLERGLSNLGEAPLRKALTQMDIAKTEHEIGRQKELDALQRPGLTRQSQIDQQALGRAARPVKLTDYASTPGDAMLSFYSAKDEGGKSAMNPLVSEIQRALDAEWDTNPQSQTHNMLISKKTGKPITQGESEATTSALMRSRMGWEHSLDAMETNLRFGRSQGKVKDQEFNRVLSELTRMRKDPNERLKFEEGQIAFLSKFAATDDPVVKENVTAAMQRHQGNIDQIRGVQAEAGKRAFEMEKLKTEHGYRLSEKKAVDKDGEKGAFAQRVATVMDAYQVDKATATNMVRSDETLAERIRGYSEEVSAKQESIDMMDEAAKARELEAIADKWKLTPKKQGEPDNDPLGIR